MVDLVVRGGGATSRDCEMLEPLMALWVGATRWTNWHCFTTSGQPNSSCQRDIQNLLQFEGCTPKAAQDERAAQCGQLAHLEN